MTAAPTARALRVMLVLTAGFRLACAFASTGSDAAGPEANSAAADPVGAQWLATRELPSGARVSYSIGPPLVPTAVVLHHHRIAALGLEDAAAYLAWFSGRLKDAGVEFMRLPVETAQEATVFATRGGDGSETLGVIWPDPAGGALQIVQIELPQPDARSPECERLLLGLLLSLAPSGD